MPTPTRAVQPVSRARQLAELTRLGCYAGLATGAIQLLILGILRFGFGKLIWHGREVLWMAPLANTLLFGVVAFVLAGIATLLRLRIPAGLFAGFLGFLAALSLLLPFRELARWAALLLALGMGIQLGRVYASAPYHWGFRLRRIGIGVALAALALGAGQLGWSGVRRALSLQRLGPTDSGLPNVLLIILDTVRGEELSLYGFSRATTPALERWAARGVVFDAAVAPAPWTLPSHGALLTGESGERLGGGWLEPVHPASPTLAELFRGYGYQTGAFVANLLYTSYESGLTRGFLDYQDYPLSFTQLLTSAPLLQTGLAQSLLRARSLDQLRQAVGRFNLHISRLPADEYVQAETITRRFLLWQERVRDRPFFAFLNYFDAHGPYRSPAGFQRKWAPAGKPLERYDAAIAYLDAELDRVFTTLEQRGVLERTIVAVASDHGELFGEHGLHGHANALYLPLLRVPLVLRYPPRVPAGLRVATPVSLADVPATLLELATDARQVGLAGTSLVGLWDTTRKSGPVPPVFSSVARSRERNSAFPNDATWLESALDDSHHYIRSGAKVEQLFAWRADPGELHNLVGSPGSQEVIRRLGAALDSARRR